MDDLTGMSLISCMQRFVAESRCPEGDYIDLTLNPEKFTGYAGPSAHRVWRSIYEENCFGISESTLLSGVPQPASMPDTMADVLLEDGEDTSGLCLEKRVYYKVISGAFFQLQFVKLPFILEQVCMHPFRHTYVPIA